MAKKLKIGEIGYERINNWEGGMNDVVNAALLNEDESPLLENASLDEKGTLSPREGSDERYAVALDGNIAGMGSFYKSDGTSRLLIGTDAGKLYVDTPHVINKYSTQAEVNNGEAHNLYVNTDGEIVPLIFRDDFEGGLGEWTYDTGWSYQNTVAIAGTYSAKGEGQAIELKYDLDRDLGEVYFKSKVRCPAANKKNVIIGKNGTAQVDFVIFQDDGTLQYDDGTEKAFEVATSYSADTNYTVEVILSEGYYYVYVDSSCITPSGIALKDNTGNAITQIDTVGFEAGETGVTGIIYADDVKVNYTVPVFTRNATATEGSTTYLAGNPRYVSIDVSDTINDDFSTGVLTDVQNDSGLKLTPAGAVVTDTDTTTAEFGAGTLTDVTAADDSLKLTQSQNYGITAEGSSVNNSSASDYEFGWKFTVGASDFVVNKLRVKLGETTTGIKLNLWQVSDGSRLSTVTVNPTANTWVEGDITPVTLSATASYVVSVGVPAGIDYKTTSSPSTANTYNSAITYVESLSDTPLDAYPTSTITSMMGTVDIVGDPEYASTGNRISPDLNLATVVTASTSSISWNATTPAGTTLTIEAAVSTNSGSSWGAYAACTSGNAIPGITASMDVSTTLVRIKQTLETTDTSATPTLSDITVTVNSEYPSTGNRVSSALTFGISGGADSSSIDWVETKPTGTDITVELSWDGTTWEACTNGGAIPSISGKDLFRDDFQVKQTLTTTDTTATPTLTSLTIEVANGESATKAIHIEATGPDKLYYSLPDMESEWFLSFAYYPDFASTDANQRTLAQLYYDATNSFTVEYDNTSTSDFILSKLIGATETTATATASFGAGERVRIAVAQFTQAHNDLAAGLHIWVKSGAGSVVHTTTASATTPTNADKLYIGCGAVTGTECNGDITNVILKDITSLEARGTTINNAWAEGFLSGTPTNDVSTMLLATFNDTLEVTDTLGGVWISPEIDVSTATDTTTGTAAVTTSTPGSTAVDIYSRSSADSATWTAWEAVVADAIATGNNYVQLLIVETATADDLPSASDIVVSFDGSPSAALLSSSFTANAEFYFATLTDNVVVVNGVDAPQKYDGTTLSAVGGSPPTANYIEVHKNRMWMTSGSRLYFSDLLDIEDWPVLNFIDISPNDGDHITGIKQVGDYLVITKQHSTWLLAGDSSSTFSVRRIHANRGAYAPRSLEMVNDNLCFISDDGIYFSNLVTTVLISERVKEYWDDLNSRRLSQVACWHTDHKLYIAVPSANSLVNDKVIVYDSLRQCFVGIIPDWSISCFAQFREGGKRIALFGHSDAGQVSEIGSGYSDNGVAIPFKWKSRELDFGAPEVLKRWNQVFMDIVPASTDVTLTLTFYVDGATKGPMSITVPGDSTGLIHSIVAYASEAGVIDGRRLAIQIQQSVNEDPIYIHGVNIEYMIRGLKPSVYA